MCLAGKKKVKDDCVGVSGDNDNQNLVKPFIQPNARSCQTCTLHCHISNPYYLHILVVVHCHSTNCIPSNPWIRSVTHHLKWFTKCLACPKTQQIKIIFKCERSLLEKVAPSEHCSFSISFSCSWEIIMILRWNTTSYNHYFTILKTTSFLAHSSTVLSTRRPGTMEAPQARGALIFIDLSVTVDCLYYLTEALGHLNSIQFKVSSNTVFLSLFSHYRWLIKGKTR